MKIVLTESTTTIVAELEVPVEHLPDIIRWHGRYFVYNPASRHDDAFDEATIFEVP